jgi:DMSO reductase iron-sulfur subunit
MFKVRDNEPAYAFIPQSDAPEKNQYGKDVELVEKNHSLAGKSLNINGDRSVSNNPDRYKQHGFYFNADNCISCHACESACSEKNNLPSYLAYRAVGYVEGGTYPNYTRLNISMACNHCDDPVCLKGCPTRAYTKFAEYGAVLQDPDICFGCGYCTWVCPYNAPQLDTEKGHVHKCNMCVDRLEVGLKPACASACLAGALDFGVIETTPENRDQLETKIPGFPSPEITHPNIRFQQTRSLPREMIRTDSIPLRYERDEQGQGDYKTKVRDLGKPVEWNIKKLRSREDPLVLFTLISQLVIGAFILMFLGSVFGDAIGLAELSYSAYPKIYSLILFSLLGLETFALALSTMHLGKPHRFYRAFNNLRYSPVSREVASIAVFFNLLAVYTLLVTFPVLLNWLISDALLENITGFAGWVAVIAGPVALFFMHKIYRIQARPFWNHWQVLTSFYGNMLTLGSMILMAVFGAALLYLHQPLESLFTVLGSIMLLGLVMEATGLYYHARDMVRQGSEGAASYYEQTTRFGHTYRLRNVLLILSIITSFVLLLVSPNGLLAYALWAGVMVMVVTQALIGRALFYVLVIPTTMPGAFFWRNRGFEQHARESGLADMHQVGVLPDTH